MSMTSNITLYRKQQIKYLIADILSALLIWGLFLTFRWLVYAGKILGMTEIIIPMFNFYTPLILYPLGCVIVYYLSGYYIQPLWHSKGHELFLTFISAIVISFTAFFIIVIDDKVVSYKDYYMSLLVLFLLQFSLSYIPRLIITLITHFKIRHGIYAYNTALIVNKNASKRWHGQEKIVAVIDVDELQDFESLKQQYGIGRVIVNLGREATENDLYKVISIVYPHEVEIAFPARVYDMLTGAARIKDLRDNPLVWITDYEMTDAELCMKRAFDIIASSLSLLLLSPLFILITLLIKIDSKGSVIYRQERIGLYGRPFNILKFRTMQADAEQDDVPQLSQENDPRITKIGRWLRKYRLDELPQFINILKGEMSIVGPRPERKYFIDKIEEVAPYYPLLYNIRPGLTSWGPIRVGYTDTLEKMVMRLNYDIAYMSNMSLLLDVKIMLFTINVLINGKGQ